MTGRTHRTFAATLVLVVVASLVAGCSPFGNGLAGKTFQLTGAQETVPPMEAAISAEDLGRYAITFNNDGSASIKADCNTVAATYETPSGSSLKIVPGASTMVACPEDSMGSQFVTLLSGATSYATVGAKMIIYIGNEGSLEFAELK